MLKQLLLPVIAATALAGCSSTIHKRAVVGGASTLSVDAKQRLTFSLQRMTADGTSTVYCAEPSPDVFSVAAASLAAQVDTPEDAVSAQAAASIQEAAATIGRRSQTIQILRDGYYRLCEAYANGAIGTDEYRAALVEIDGVIIATLGIDSLAGVAPVGAVAISSAPQKVEVATNADGTVTVTADESSPADATPLGAASESMSAEQAKAIKEIVLFYLKHVDKRRSQLSDEVLATRYGSLSTRQLN